MAKPGKSVETRRQKVSVSALKVVIPPAGIGLTTITCSSLMVLNCQKIEINIYLKKSQKAEIKKKKEPEIKLKREGAKLISRLGKKIIIED